MIYGYCRISRKQQSIDRQVRNIIEYNSEAKIYTEAFTGTTSDRPEWKKLLKKVAKGDTIIFDSVSRMSRNAADGLKDYMELYDKGVELVFLKEPHINTQTYKNAVNVRSVELTGGTVDIILNAVNEYLKELAKEQIILAFEQSEKEVEDLRQRTREGIKTARTKGKQIGNAAGSHRETQKAKECKAEIQKKSKTFGGTYLDKDLIKMLGITRNTYYKYKNELQNMAGRTAVYTSVNLSGKSLKP